MNLPSLHQGSSTPHGADSAPIRQPSLPCLDSAPHSGSLAPCSPVLLRLWLPMLAHLPALLSLTLHTRWPLAAMLSLLCDLNPPRSESLWLFPVWYFTAAGFLQGCHLYAVIWIPPADLTLMSTPSLLSGSESPHCSSSQCGHSPPELGHPYSWIPLSSCLNFSILGLLKPCLSPAVSREDTLLSLLQLIYPTLGWVTMSSTFRQHEHTYLLLPHLMAPRTRLFGKGKGLFYF